MIPPHIYTELRCVYKRMNAAEGNLACIADALNTIARETGQREEFNYLGHCTLRDALQRIVYRALSKAREEGEDAGFVEGRR